MWKLYYIKKILKEKNGKGTVDVILILIFLIILIIIFNPQIVRMLKVILM